MATTATANSHTHNYKHPHNDDLSSDDDNDLFHDVDEYNKSLTRPSLQPAKLNNINVPPYAQVNTNNSNTYNNTNNNSIIQSNITNNTTTTTTSPDRKNKPLPQVPAYATVNTAASNSNKSAIQSTNSGTLSSNTNSVTNTPPSNNATTQQTNYSSNNNIQTNTTNTNQQQQPQPQRKKRDIPVYATLNASQPAAISSYSNKHNSSSYSTDNSNNVSPNASLNQPIKPFNTLNTTEIQSLQHRSDNIVASNQQQQQQQVNTTEPTTFKDLDTGQTYTSYDDLKSRRPEVMTIDTYDNNRWAGSNSTSNSEHSSRSQSRTHSVSNADTTQQNDNENSTNEKRNNLGYKLEKLVKKALHINQSDSENNNTTTSNNRNQYIKTKVKKKAYSDLTELKLVQTVTEHSGPIWSFAISHDGQYIATGGQDGCIRVWAIIGSQAANEMEQTYRTQYNNEQNNNTVHSNTPSVNSQQYRDSNASDADTLNTSNSNINNNNNNNNTTYIDLNIKRIIWPIPYRIYYGHKADIVDIQFSKADFILSASIDKTVRLWHISRPKCLCIFAHSDFVTAVSFHPYDDKYFVSASFDKKLRIWNIPEHRVIEWTQCSTIITSCTFSPNGLLTVAGLYNGQAIFYTTDGLKYYTQVECRNRHGKYKNGKKITGLQYTYDGKQLLVTTNDSRIRLYDMSDYRVIAKFKGLQNDELQIKASFDETHRYIICGSESEYVYIYNTTNANGKIDSYEAFKACQDTVTAAKFMPRSSIRLYNNYYSNNNNNQQSNTTDNANVHTSNTTTTSINIQHCIVAAGYNGELKLFENTGLRKHV